MFKLESRIAHERLRRICFLDPDREIALVIERRHRGACKILGVGRLSKLRGANEAEYAIIIGDAWHRQGLGTRLLELLVKISREEKVARLFAHILPGNQTMQHISRKCGFALRYEPIAGEQIAEMAL